MGVTINGLAILCRDPACSGRPVGYDLEAAFAEWTLGGPGSFVVTRDRSPLHLVHGASFPPASAC